MAKKVPLSLEEENAEKARYGGMLKADIESAASAVNTAKTKASEAAGDLSGKLDIFEQRGGVKRALKEANKVANMEPSERSDYLRARAAYEDALGCYDQADMVDQLAEQQKNADDISAATAKASKTSTAKPSVGSEPAQVAH